MREFEHGYFPSSDEKHKCHYVFMMPDGEPVGILQIAHGMCEYIERYAEFMSFMADNGYIVCGNDHLGHGKTVNVPEELGYFSPENGWQNVVKDLHRLTVIMKKRHPGLPYFFLGHSMGSFLARAYAVKFGRECLAFVFMGTGDGMETFVKDFTDKSAAVNAELAQRLGSKNRRLSSAAVTTLLSQLEILKKVKGDDFRSEVVQKIVFGSYNDRIEDAVTGVEWLSRDPETIDKNIHDPLCRFNFTVNGYINLMSVMWYVNADKWYQNVPKDIPMLLIAGTDDPVGRYGEGVRSVYQRMLDCRCDVSLKLYEKARHELLNEINRQEVFDDLLGFFGSLI